jgi:2-polyprenyl-3-methyl-5-hydroxy-6-metoxy-1,4-benzoquinol methylase
MWDLTMAKSEIVSPEDRAGVGYWNGVWQRTALPPPFDPRTRGLKSLPARQLHRYFELAFAGYATRGKQLLEIGCGNSAFLPYFSRHFGFEVSGIDYSQLGCVTAERMLERENVRGEIVLGDLHHPPDCLVRRFDVAFSGGVVEHFSDTARCIYACSRFVRQGGTLITLIPNLAGLMGPLQKLLDRSVYEVHVPLTKTDLVSANRTVGLTVKSCDYIVPLALNALNIDGWGKTFAYKCFRGVAHLLSVSAWMAESVIPSVIKPNSWTSPWICCVATVPADRAKSELNTETPT